MSRIAVSVAGQGDKRLPAGGPFNVTISKVVTKKGPQADYLLLTCKCTDDEHMGATCWITATLKAGARFMLRRILEAWGIFSVEELEDEENPPEFESDDLVGVDLVVYLEDQLNTKTGKMEPKVTKVYAPREQVDGEDEDNAYFDEDE